MKTIRRIFGIEPLAFYIQKRMDQQNLNVGIFMAILTTLTSIVMLMSMRVYQMSVFTIRIQRFMYSCLLVASLGLVVVGVLHFNQHKIKHMYIVGVLNVYVLACLIFGIINSIVKYAVGDHMMSYVTMNIWVFCLFRFRPIYMIGLSAIEFVLMHNLMEREGLGYYNIGGIFILWLVLVIACILRYRQTIYNIRLDHKIKKINWQLKTSNTHLIQQTTIDELTNVQNRFALRYHFDAFLDKHVIVAIVDLDQFKMYNDTYGHDIGDAVLKRFGQVLIHRFGKSNCFRYGGDEFLIIVDMGPDTFEQCVMEIRHQCERVVIADVQLSISFSLGYVFGYTEDPKTLRSMLRMADHQLYDVKKQGKNGTHGILYPQ